MADLGQVFTKGVVARYMVSLFELPKQAAIMDPCYGAGSFLDALLAAEYCNVTACEMKCVEMFPQNKKVPKIGRKSLKNTEKGHLTSIRTHRAMWSAWFC